MILTSPMHPLLRCAWEYVHCARLACQRAWSGARRFKTITMISDVNQRVSEKREKVRMERNYIKKQKNVNLKRTGGQKEKEVGKEKRRCGKLQEKS